MEPTAVKALLENAQAAARLMQTRRPLRPRSASAPDFPLPPPGQPGLRSLEQTQTLDVLRTKGTIIDRLL